MKNIEEKIFDYLEGSLSNAERQAFEDLMAQNPALKMEVESIRKTDAVFSANNMIERLGDGFSDEIISKIGERKSRFQTSNRLLWLALSLFALIFVAVLLILPAMQSGGSGYTLPQNWIPTMPTFDGGKIVEVLDNPALMQLALIINAIALLLVLDKVLSNRQRMA